MENRLSEVAMEFLGQHEKGHNVFDQSTLLGQLLEAAGHVDGEAWCDLFVEAMCKRAMPEREKFFDDIFTKSAVGTATRFQKRGFKLSKTPVVDSIFYQQKYVGGVKQWQGHTGIVCKVNEDGSFESVEGNTGSKDPREGDGVYRKYHRPNFDTNDGLRLLGFIKP